ncbi:MAG: recombinase family protein [Mycobacteriales bacterium]
MRVATYTRISTDESHQPYSLDAQAVRLAAYVASQPDWQQMRSFTDQQSGAKLERPALQRALREARAGRFDLLLVYRVDRLARSVRGLAQILEELDAAGVAFRSATEPFDTATAAGRMMVQMLGVFAEFERSTIIDRVVAGMERAAARGGWMGGQAPYGYAISPDGGQLVVNTDEAPLVSVIFRRYARDLLGSHALADWLTSNGHRTRSGRPWSYRAVLTVLRNRVYLGEVNFRGATHPGEHPPLVDTELFTAAQRLLERRGSDVSKRASNSSEYLLTGLITCTHCHKPYVGTAATGKCYRYRYYSCITRIRYGTRTCPAERLPAEELDDAVVAALLATYERHDLFDAAARDSWQRAQAGRAQLDAELSTVEAEITKTETAVERYLAAFETGSLPEDQCATRVRRHGVRLIELRDRRAELTEQLARDTLVIPTPAYLAQVREHVRAVLKTGSEAGRKAALQELIEEIQATSRAHIVPIFRVPAEGDIPTRDNTDVAGVRAPYRRVHPCARDREGRDRGFQRGSAHLPPVESLPLDERQDHYKVRSRCAARLYSARRREDYSGGVTESAWRLIGRWSPTIALSLLRRHCSAPDAEGAQCYDERRTSKSSTSGTSGACSQGDTRSSCRLARRSTCRDGALPRPGSEIWKSNPVRRR